MRLLLSLLLCGAALPAAPAAGAEPFGVLLLGEGGDHRWRQAVLEIRRALGRVPLEFAPGLADTRAIQKGVEALEAKNVRKIVAVPLCLSSFSEVMDQSRFLLGIREKPSREFLGAPHAHDQSLGARRVRTRLPLVLTQALDGHPLLVEALASRAKALSREPSLESLVLVGQAPRGPEAARDFLASTRDLAEKARTQGGFKSAEAAALGQGSQEERAKEAEALRRLVRARRREGPVIVLPLELGGGALSSRIPKALGGLLVRYDGRMLLPDPRIARWALESALSGAGLPDMRRFGPAGGRAPARVPNPGGRP